MPEVLMMPLGPVDSPAASVLLWEVVWMVVSIFPWLVNIIIR